MQYEDDEGDKVLLTTDSDLAGAVFNAKSSGLKVFLFSDVNPFCLLKVLPFEHLSYTVAICFSCFCKIGDDLAICTIGCACLEIEAGRTEILSLFVL